MRSMKVQHNHRGTSLLEVLVVLVVFAVGILVFLQIFPVGINVLRENRDRAQVMSLVRSESQRLAGQPESLPNVVAPVQVMGGGAFIQIDSAFDLNLLYPPMNDPIAGTGEIDQDGIVYVGGSPIGHWTKLSGLNRVSRVIGETWKVPGPTVVGGELASRVNLNFAPIVYDPAAPANGLLQVYGNDLNQTLGSTDDGIPLSTATTYDPYQYVLVNQENAQNGANTPFAGEDQIWIGRLRNTSTNLLLDHQIRLSMTFYYNSGGTIRPVDAIFVLTPGDPGVINVNNYLVLSLPQIIQSGGYLPADYRGFEAGSLEVQRMYQPLAVATSFTPGDAYQYKVYNGNLGTLLLNPTALEQRVRTSAGELIPLIARIDYTVYDWRILRDEFRVPTNSPAVVKLIVNSITPLSGRTVTGGTNTGLGGFLAGDTSLWTPTHDGTVRSDDFILMDMQTGGVIVGNGGSSPDSSYIVDKSTGAITMIDADPAAGLQGILYVPSAAGWVRFGPVNMEGRLLRALYMANGELAIQPTKAANTYHGVYPPAVANLGVTQYYPGAATGWGQPNRIYFPVMDVGQKVTIGEVRVTDGATQSTLRNQDYRITGKEDFGGVILGYVQLPTGFTLDYSTNGYPVRWVKGISFKVRALWNPTTFVLGGDLAENFENFKIWAQSWRPVTTESFEAGASLE